MRVPKLHLLAICAGVALLAGGCGGGSGDASLGPGDNPPASASVLTGTAATGAALANANVAVTNGSGGSPCVEATITTTALGSYTCTLKAGETAPFFVVVTDPTGNTPPMVSVSTTAPAAGTSLVLNATPLTTAIVAQLAADGDPLSVVGARTVDAATLQAVTRNVVEQLASVLTAIGMAPGYDPFTTAITAATASAAGNTADLVLDVVKVVTDPATGKLALATIDNPTPVPLATTVAGAAVAAPDAAVTSLSTAAQLVAAKFSECFALPVSARATQTVVLSGPEGGPEVTAVGAACDGFVSDASNAGGIDFLHNGYSAGQLFYSLMTSESMSGAKFSVPEIMAFYPKNATASAPDLDAYDRAVLNLRFADANGDPGNVIVVAAKIPASASADRPTEWWLVGNQHPADVSAKPQVRRFEQVNPAASASRASQYQSGIQFNINNQGPGSIHPTLGALKYARVSGPGLPGDGAANTGLVYMANGRFMDLVNKNGALQAANGPCGGNSSNCPNLWFERTAGVTGTAAATLAPNPAGLAWAQPGQADVSKVVKGARYKIELFYGTDTANPVVFHKTLLSDVVPAVTAAKLPWNELGARSRAALDPLGSLAGDQPALEMDWVQNPSAQQVGGVEVGTGTIANNGQGFSPYKAVPRGATSVVVDNATTPAFTATTGLRQLLLSYRMLDGSIKTSVTSYN